MKKLSNLTIHDYSDVSNMTIFKKINSRFLFYYIVRKRNFTYSSDLSVNLSIHYIQRNPEDGKIILDKTLTLTTAKQVHSYLNEQLEALGLGGFIRAGC